MPDTAASSIPSRSSPAEAAFERYVFIISKSSALACVPEFTTSSSASVSISGSSSRGILRNGISPPLWSAAGINYILSYIL